MQSRCDGDAAEISIHPGDCYIIGDAGKTGSRTALLAAFVDENGLVVERTTSSLKVHYDEEEPQSRRVGLRGNMCIEQDEAFYYLTKEPLLTSVRPRLHVPRSTTAGTAMGPLPVPATKDQKATWHLQLKDIKKNVRTF